MKARLVMGRLIVLLMLLGALPGFALAAENPYRQHTDEELTALAGDWDSLDRYQRRALLTEMKLRMARNGERKGVIHIRTERRYGRLIRQSDGRVIHIETQVVHVRPVGPDELEARRSFGIGFEHRVGQREQNLVGTEDAQPASAPDEGAVDAQPSLNSILESLTPSTQAPEMRRLPIYQASDPKP